MNNVRKNNFNSIRQRVFSFLAEHVADITYKIRPHYVNTRRFLHSFRKLVQIDVGNCWIFERAKIYHFVVQVTSFLTKEPKKEVKLPLLDIHGTI